MPIEINGISYLTAAEVCEKVYVTRQTLWRWRQKGKIPPGYRYRGRGIVFSPAEVKAIQEFANRIEPIEPPTNGQLGLFNPTGSKS
jgi:predicted DNA-binding transcriptional regulator AlpA